MFLQWSKVNDYRHISVYSSTSNLRFLVNFFADDYRDYYHDMYYRVATSFNINFVYNDFAKYDMYIGFSEWEVDENMHCPDDEEFQNYVNESNSCKINQSNFMELAKNWMDMKKFKTPFAIIYRDENDWVYCKGFDSQEAMELFVKNYKPEVMH